MREGGGGGVSGASFLFFHSFLILFSFFFFFAPFWDWEFFFGGEFLPNIGPPVPKNKLKLPTFIHIGNLSQPT